jgi:hypothetical protein
MHKRNAPAGRLYFAAAALIIGKIGWLVLVCRLILNVLPHQTVNPVGATVVALGSLFRLAAGAAAIRDRSVLWQVLLQSTAGGAIAAGVGLLMRALFYNSSVLIGTVGLVGAGALWLAFFAARLMRHIQTKSTTTHDAV